MTDLKRMRELKSSKALNATDIVVIVLLVAATVFAAAYTLFGRKKGAVVSVTADGTTAEYSLSNDREIVLPGLTVVIEGGTVYVKDSRCPDKLCEHMGRIDSVGESIVCLPAGIVVTIEGESEFQVSTGQEK